MTEYIELKKRCDICYGEMGEVERLLNAAIEEIDKVYHSGCFKELKNVLPVLQKVKSRAKGYFCVAGYSKRNIEVDQDKREPESEDKYWKDNIDVYLWQMEVALQSMWCCVHDLKKICSERIEKHPDKKESMVPATGNISEAYSCLENAAVKWKEANALWLELFDSDHAVRNSSNPNMTIWRGQHIDYRESCAEENGERHIYSMSKALPEYKEKYFLPNASGMTEKLRNY